MHAPIPQIKEERTLAKALPATCRGKAIDMSLPLFSPSDGREGFGKQPPLCNRAVLCYKNGRRRPPAWETAE